MLEGCHGWTGIGRRIFYAEILPARGHCWPRLTLHAAPPRVGRGPTKASVCGAQRQTALHGDGNVGVRQVPSIIHCRFLDHSSHALRADHIRLRRTLLHADGPIEPFSQSWDLHAYLALMRDFAMVVLTSACTPKPPPHQSLSIAPARPFVLMGSYHHTLL